MIVTSADAGLFVTVRLAHAEASSFKETVTAESVAPSFASFSETVNASPVFVL